MASKAAPGGVFALVMLGIIGTLNFVDRQILSVLIEPIRADLHFSDTQFALLTGLAFSLFYGAVGLPAAMIADRFNRVRLVAAACFLWSFFTAATGLVRGFGGMAFVRFGVGVGEAGGTAPSLSILADYFPRERRPLVVGLFTLNGPVGVFVGAAFGGWAAAELGWRGAFFVLGIIGMIAAPLLWLLVKEPPRGRFDPPAPERAAPASFFRALGNAIMLYVRDPHLRMVAIAAGTSSFLSYGMLNWIPAYLMRVEGMPLSAIALWFAPVAGITFGIGMVGGGWVVTRWVAKSMAGYAAVPAIATAILIPFFAASLLVTGWQWSLALMMIPLICCTIFTPATIALAQELGPPHARATVTATLLLMFNIVGLGLGSLYVGAISDLNKASMGDESLRVGLLALLVPAVLAVIAHGVLARSLSQRQAVA